MGESTARKQHKRGEAPMEDCGALEIGGRIVRDPDLAMGIFRDQDLQRENGARVISLARRSSSEQRLLARTSPPPVRRSR
jgi:hypothetical protein